MSEESVAILVLALWKRCRTSRRMILGRAGLVIVGVVVVWAVHGPCMGRAWAVHGGHGCFGEVSADVLMTGV
jgi:drug/metabolite transporter superfamily protein YnfA